MVARLQGRLGGTAARLYPLVVTLFSFYNMMELYRQVEIFQDMGIPADHLMGMLPHMTQDGGLSIGFVLWMFLGWLPICAAA